MNKKSTFSFLIAMLFAAIAFSQNLVAEKAIIVNSGVFEFTAPFADYVTVGSYNIFSKNYTVFDTIPAQSAQAIFVDKEMGFVVAENKIAKYNLKTEQKIATGTYNGVAPHSVAANRQKVLVGNWYGQTDSNLYIYDANSLALLNITPGISKDVKAIALAGDTAYIAQNVSGSVDACAPFGCYADSIGYIVVVNIATNQIIDTLVMDTAIAGVNSLFLENNHLVAVNSVSKTVLDYNLLADSYTNTATNLNVSKGLSLKNGTLSLLTNNNISLWNAPLGSIVQQFGLPNSGAAATIFNPDNNAILQTTTDYTSFGKLFEVSCNQNTDSTAIGISPENMAFYFAPVSPVIANNDAISITYNQDTLIPVLVNDIDSNTIASTVTIISGPKVIGATASVINNQIYYTPQVGLIIKDTLVYTLCNAGGFCDTAIVYIEVRGITNTAIENIDFSTVNVYPNPFTNNIIVNSAFEIDAIEVSSIDEKVLFSKEKIGNTTNIQTEDFATGIYLLKIVAGNQQKTIKLVK